MSCLKLNDSIEIIDLSLRTKNCLKKENILTVEDILNYPLTDWKEIKGFGEKCQNEILEFIYLAKENIIDYNFNDDYSENIDTDENERKIKTFIAKDGTEYIDILITDDIVTTRGYNCLKKAGYVYFSEILDLSFEYIRSMQNMGAKTANIVFNAISTIEFHKVIKKSDEDKKIEDLSRKISRIFKLNFNTIKREIYKCRNDYPDAKGESFLNLVFEIEEIKTNVKKFLIYYIQKHEEGTTKEELLSLIPIDISNTTILEQLLIELEMDNQIFIEDDLIKYQYISIIEYLRKYENNKKISMLIDRIDGLTLEEIGRKHNVTRERVRQITTKELDKIPRVKEDIYKYCFNNYDFSLEDFKIAFNEPDFVYHYMYISSERKGKQLEDALDDENISEGFKKKIEKAIYKKYEFIDGMYIKRERWELVKYVIRTQCTEKTSFNIFIDKYSQFLLDNNLSDYENLKIHSRTYETKLALSNYVLWNQWKSFRYYNIDNHNFEPLLEVLCLEQYKNVEMSTLKLYRDNKEIMREYDIQDEYELHNLLKKICVENKNIEFRKMPTIAFGKADRDEQVFNFMLEHAPIEINDFCNKYEEQYGFKSTTVLGSYLESINPYLDNGVYRIDEEPFTLEVEMHMKELLTEDAYSIENIRNIFSREYPHLNPNLINSYNIKNLGFRIYSGYVIRDIYSNALEYFNNIFLKNDIIDLTDFNKNIFGNAIYNYLINLKINRDIIEFSPNKYISIRKLNENNIYIKDLIDYCDEVYKYLDKGTFFTVHSLKSDGFRHYLDNLGFDEYFYSSIIVVDNRFSYRRLGNTNLIFIGQRKITLSDLVIYIVKLEKKIDLYTLENLLMNRYGIKFNKDKIVEIIKDTDLYYSKIMKAVYADYDTYFEEV